MKKRITIKITEEHIRNGFPYEETNCPIALAARKYFQSPYVDEDYIKDLRDENNRKYVLPDIAQVFIHNFDNLGQDGVKPFEFDLEIDR